MNKLTTAMGIARLNILYARKAMKSLVLGQKVIGGPRLYRQHIYDKKNKTRLKRWVAKGSAPVSGILIGYRNYANGNLGFDVAVGYHLLPTDYIRVALIVEDLNRNPVPVMAYSLTKA